MHASTLPKTSTKETYVQEHTPSNTMPRDKTSYFANANELTNTALNTQEYSLTNLPLPETNYELYGPNSLVLPPPIDFGLVNSLPTSVPEAFSDYYQNPIDRSLEKHVPISDTVNSLKPPHSFGDIDRHILPPPPINHDFNIEPRVLNTELPPPPNFSNNFSQFHPQHFPSDSSLINYDPYHYNPYGYNQQNFAPRVPPVGYQGQPFIPMNLNIMIHPDQSPYFQQMPRTENYYAPLELNQKPQFIEKVPPPLPNTQPPPLLRSNQPLQSDKTKVVLPETQMETFVPQTIRPESNIYTEPVAQNEQTPTTELKREPPPLPATKPPPLPKSRPPVPSKPKSNLSKSCDNLVDALDTTTPFATLPNYNNPSGTVTNSISTNLHATKLRNNSFKRHSVAVIQDKVIF